MLSDGTHSGLVFATAVTRGDPSRQVLNVSSRRVCRCRTRSMSRPGARSRCWAMCKDMCGSCIVQSRRVGGRGARALGLGAVGRTHLMALEPWQPKPRADRRLSHWLRIWSWRGLAQHEEHRRDAAASTRSRTSTSSGAGASVRSAGRSRRRPRARRRPQHSRSPTVVTLDSKNGCRFRAAGFLVAQQPFRTPAAADTQPRARWLRARRSTGAGRVLQLAAELRQAASPGRRHVFLMLDDERSSTTSS